MAANCFLHQWGYPGLPHTLLCPREGQASQVPLAQYRKRTVWASHVVSARGAVVRVGSSLLILDPAISPSAPLGIREWMMRFSTDDDIDVALSRDRSLGDGCFEGTPVEPPAPEKDAPSGSLYIRMVAEWNVQELLGRDPQLSLSKCPPWLPCAEPEPTP
jgi:hypothetical protein